MKTGSYLLLSGAPKCPKKPHPPVAAEPRSRNYLATVFAGGLAVAALLVVSLALYTDTENVTNNTFSTGTIDLTATPATAVVTMPAMFPGDQITAPLTIGNAGSAQLRYTMTSTTTEDTLAGELVLTVEHSVTTCSDAGFGVDDSALHPAPWAL